MIAVPRLLQHNGRLMLISVTKHAGQIVQFNGVYKALSDPDQTPEAFIKNMVDLMHRARHEDKVLTVDDLPAAEREQILAAFAAS